MPRDAPARDAELRLIFDFSSIDFDFITPPLRHIADFSMPMLYYAFITLMPIFRH